ncbi:unnamed protein product, partial [Cuscuta europaea]
MDRAALGTYDDDALENKILRSSLTACIALGEQARRGKVLRLEKVQQDEQLKKLVHDNAEAVRQMAKLEEALQQMELQLEAANKGKAEAEKTAVEAAKKAVEEAEEAKNKAISVAREEAVGAFVAEGWRAEGRKQWLALVMKASVDEWCGGPGVEWLARKGKEYYDGGEYFTQALIYRRLARHYGVEPKDFDPA